MYAFKVRSRVYHLFSSDTDLTVCNLRVSKLPMTSNSPLGLSPPTAR